MRIWKNRETLLEDYVPPELPGRESEINEVMRFMAIIPVGRPPNLLVYGPRGTGKTVAIKKIFRDLTKLYNPETVRPIYVMAETPLNTLAQIAYELGIIWRSRRRKIRGLPRGISIAEALDTLREEIKKYSRVIIAIDEADKLAGNPNGEEILYHFTRTIPVSLILITNKPLFKQRIKDDRVVSSLRLRFIDFPRYNDEQILEILKYRASISLQEEAYNDDILDTIRHLTIRRGGRDIRFGLDLLLAAGDLAYTEGASRIEAKHIEDALIYAEEEMARRALEKLDLEEQIIIYVVAKKRRIPLKKLRDIVREITFASKVRFQHALRELRLMDIVSVESKGLGKGKGKEFFISWTEQWSRELALSLIDRETRRIVDRLLGELPETTTKQVTGDSSSREAKKEHMGHSDNIDWSGFVRLSTSHEDNYSLVKIIVTNSSVPAEYIVDVILSQVGPADSKLMVYVEYPLFKKTTIKIERKNGKFKVIVLSPKKREITTQKLKETLKEILSQLKN